MEATCRICGQPEAAGYVNEAAGEACADLCHSELGDRVSYEDAANPRRVGIVIEVIEDGPRQFRVWFEGGSRTVSDLRQHGWKRVAA